MLETESAETNNYGDGSRRDTGVFRQKQNRCGIYIV